MIICGRDRNCRMMPSSTSATQSHQFNIGVTDKLRHCQPFCVWISSTVYMVYMGATVESTCPGKSK